MSGISCCCSLPPSACKTCIVLHPELHEIDNNLHEIDNNLHEIDNNLPSPTYLLIGWVCPVCSCGVAPNISQCSCQVKTQEEKNL